MAGNLPEGRFSDRVGDISILIIDHDTASIASLTTVLQNFSTKVMSVGVASKALSMIEEHKDIGLIIANVEMPQLDSESFLNSLLHNDITLTLMKPKKKNHKTSDLLTNKARFCLNKPISEDDIKDMWEYVLPKNVIDEQKNQIEAFRKSLKRQRISQASLVGKRRPFINTFTSPDTYQQRRNLADDEWRKNQNYPIEIVNKSEGKKILENDFGRRCNLWTKERHMKFLAALSILGEENIRPTSILEIINDPELTIRQVASHLQKYKAQVDRIIDTFPRKEWKLTDKTFNYPSDYEYPFKASNLRKNLIEANTLWNSLRKKNSSSSSISQFSFKKPEMPKLHLGGKFDISNLSHFGNVLNKSSIDVNHVSSSKNPYPFHSTDNVNHIGLLSTGLGSQNLPIHSTDNVNHIGQLSTGLGSQNLPVHSSLSSCVGPSNTNTFQTESARVFNSQSDPNPFPPPSSTPEIDRNQLGRDVPYLLDDFTLPDLRNMGETYNSFPNYTNSSETSIDQMGRFPPIGNYSHLEGNMNQMDWIPLTENYVSPEAGMNIVAPETNIHPIGWVSSEGYIPLDNVMGSHFDIEHIGNASFGETFLPQDETNMTNVGFVSSQIPFQTNIGQILNQCSPEESYIFRENVTPFEANTSPMGLAPCETSFDALNNMVPFDANMEEMKYVPYEEDKQIPIENLISFEFDANEMNIPWWLEYHGSPEKTNPSSTRSAS